MKFKDLIYNNEWLSVEYVLLEIYPETLENLEEYRSVFEQLKWLVTVENNVILEIDRMWDEGKETNYANVHGWDPSLPDDSISKGIAIEFRPWEEWLEYEIGMDAKEEWNELEMISHSLLEMTLDGFTQGEIRESFNSIISSVSKVKEQYFKSKNEKSK